MDLQFLCAKKSFENMMNSHWSFINTFFLGITNFISSVYKCSVYELRTSNLKLKR